MSQLAIRAEGISKKFHIGKKQERYRTLRDTIVDATTGPFRRATALLQGRAVEASEEILWALKDVSFDVEEGTTTGIIGRNGAGKSTLLKVVSRITEPTRGWIGLKGRVGSLLEVGTGFHPELTGRENIYLNAAILGMKKAEIGRKFDEIVAFAETEQFLDTPVKRYSTGMRMRLAFAVAAHLDPEILLIDEVLAVGDAQFQTKCLGKMKNVAKQGRTVLFVSHNMNAVANLCSRVIWLERGRIADCGDPEAIISSYLSTAALRSNDKSFESAPGNQGDVVRILGGEIFPASDTISNGTEMTVCFRVKFLKEFQCNFVLYVYREGALAFVSADFHQPLASRPIPAGTIMEIRTLLPTYLLNPGLHSFRFAVTDFGGNTRQEANIHEVLYTTITDDGYRRGKSHNAYNKGWSGTVSPLLQMKGRFL